MSKRKKNKRFNVKSYRSYLQTSRWRKKRVEALKLAGYKCSVCGQTENLQVHHKTYATLGNEPQNHLQVLCDGCHSNHHEKDSKFISDPVTAEYREFLRNML